MTFLTTDKPPIKFQGWHLIKDAFDRVRLDRGSFFLLKTARNKSSNFSVLSRLALMSTA